MSTKLSRKIYILSFRCCFLVKTSKRIDMEVKSCMWQTKIPGSPAQCNLQNGRYCMLSCTVRSTALHSFGAVKLVISGYSALHQIQYQCITKQTKSLESIMYERCWSHCCTVRGWEHTCCFSCFVTVVLSLAGLPFNADAVQ